MADAQQPIQKIEKVKRAKEASKPVEDVAAQEDLKRMAPNKDRFDQLLSPKAEKITTEKTEPSRKSSPIEELREINSKKVPTRVTPSELIAQTQEVVNKIEEVKTKLSTPNLSLPESSKALMNNKLSHIDENIRIALSKAGIEAREGVAAAPTENPVLRFLGFLTHGQYQLQTLALEVEKMHLNKQELSPASMLSIQIKVGYIQQELEFFSGVLNKALESIKTIMNVQV